MAAARPTSWAASDPSGSPDRARPAERLVAAVLCDLPASSIDPETARAILENLDFSDEIRVVAPSSTVADVFRAAAVAVSRGAARERDEAASPVRVDVSPSGAAATVDARGLRPPGLERLPESVARAAGGGWLLVTRVDERVSLALRAEILDLVRRGASPASRNARRATVTVRRHALGRYLEHGGVDEPESRLFALPLVPDADTLTRLDRFAEARELEPGPAPDGASTVVTLEHALVELGDRTLDGRIDRLNRRTEVAAAAATSARDPVEPETCPLRLLGGEALALARRVFLRGAWRDGPRGVLAAVCDAAEFIVLQAKLHEARKRTSELSSRSE